MDGKVILLFRTTHETLLAEKALTENGVPVRPRIKPRSIASECGMGLEVEEGALKKATRIFGEQDLSVPEAFKEKPGMGWERCVLLSRI